MIVTPLAQTGDPLAPWASLSGAGWLIVTGQGNAARGAVTMGITKRCRVVDCDGRGAPCQTSTVRASLSGAGWLIVTGSWSVGQSPPWWGITKRCRVVDCDCRVEKGKPEPRGHH